MGAFILPPPSGNLGKDIQGTWWLTSREDWTIDGHKRIDPVLGPDPIGIVSYAKNHFEAQFMRRERSEHMEKKVFEAGKNNTMATEGYDAYFGTYEVAEKTGTVSHTLIGSVSPANIGITVLRHVRVNGDNMVIQLETTTPDGEPVTRTLTWNRIS